MIFVDTSVLVDFFNGTENIQTSKFEELILSDRIITGNINRIELLQGFKKDKDFNQAKKLLEKFEIVQLLNHEVSEKAIKIYRLLRKKGITVRGTIDAIIASYCLVNSIPLLCKDRDFISISKHTNLKIIH